MKNNLKRLRNEAGLTQAQMAEVAGLSLRYIAALEAGERNLNTRRIEEFAEIFGCKPIEIIGDRITQDRQIPILSWVSAGLFTECAFAVEMLQDSLGEVYLGDDTDGKFALQVTGTSMNRIAPEGALIIVDSLDRQMIDGKAYVFASSGTQGAIFKRYRSSPPRLEPFSTEGQHEILFLDPNEKDANLHVVGRVIEVRLPL